MRRPSTRRSHATVTTILRTVAGRAESGGDVGPGVAEAAEAVDGVVQQDLRQHLEAHVQPGPSVLIFTGAKGAPLRRSILQTHCRGRVHP